MSATIDEETQDRISRLEKQHSRLNDQIDEQNKQRTISDAELKSLKAERCAIKRQISGFEEKLIALGSAEKNAQQKHLQKKSSGSDFSVKKDKTDFTVIQPGTQKQANFA